MRAIEIIQKHFVIAERKKTVITASISEAEMPRLDIELLDKGTSRPINCVWLVGAEIENLRQVLNEWKGMSDNENTESD